MEIRHQNKQSTICGKMQSFCKYHISGYNIIFVSTLVNKLLPLQNVATGGNLSHGKKRGEQMQMDKQ